jgi:streptomycin 6-kinase
MFITQVLAKAAVTYLQPHDPNQPDTLSLATYHALWSTAHQDAILMPAAIAVLRYRSS